MYICPNCKKTSETPTNFCSLCGTPMVEQPTPQTEVQPTVSAAYTSQNPQPQYTENPQPPYPQYTQPQYPQYPQYTQPQTPPSKAKSIVGMVLSIVGLSFGAIGALYSLIFLMAPEGLGLFFAIVMSIFSFPPSLIGFLMCKGNVNAGDTSAFGRVGKKLGLIGLILTGVMWLLGIFGMGDGGSYRYYDF